MKITLPGTAFIICMLLRLNTSGQDITDERGKTYFVNDSGQKVLKEVFHYVLVYKVTHSPADPDSRRDTTLVVKNGPYIRYYPAGQVECTGNYHREKKDGEWRYYSPQGKLLRTEYYKDDELIR